MVVGKAIGFLDAPVQPVGAPGPPVPFEPVLVDADLPKEAEIIQAVRAVVGIGVG